MKRKFTKLMAALALLVFIAPSMVAWGQTTYKLQQVTSVEAGGLYVFEQDGYVMNNTVSSSALQTTNTYNTTGLLGSESYVWTLETATDGFYLKNVKLTSNQYLNNGSGTNVSFGSKSSIWALNFQTDNTVLIQNTSNSNRFLGYTNATSHAYKAYATSNLSSYPHAIKVYQLVEESTPTCAAPTFSPVAGTYLEARNVTISTTTDDATIYYTTDGTDPTTSSSTYSSAISVSTTTTIKAMATKEGYNNSAVASATYTISSLEHEGTEADPYTVADARTAIDANVGVTGVYATGIVSQIVTAYNSQYSNITFDLVDDEGSTVTLRAYRCEGDEAEDVAVGDIAVVSGNLTLYNGVYEFTQGCTLVSLTHPVAAVETPTFNPEAGTYTGTQTVTISCATTGATIYYTIDGTTPTNESTLYTGAITVAVTTTINAIAYNGTDHSAVATAVYNIVVPLTTMDEIMAAATAANATPADVAITFNNWIVSGVGTNAKRAFVTDGTKGFIIYNNNGGLTFTRGDVLTGTKSCQVKLLNGAPCVTGLNATDFTITQTGAQPTVTTTTIAALEAVNTGAVVDLGQLTWNGTYFVDGNDNAIYYYNTIYGDDTFTDNTMYTVKGVYVHYTSGSVSPKEIAPRDADDIQEYTPAAVPALYNYSINGVEGEAIDAYIGDVISLNTGANINDDYTFAGWTIDPNNIVLLNGSYTLTEEVTTFYAVYAKSAQGAPVSAYNKVSAISEGQYLIVYEGGSVAFDGSLETLDAVSNTINVVINNGTIASSETTDASCFTITQKVGGYSVKSASGYYIGVDSYNNGLKQNAEDIYTNDISIEGGNAIVAIAIPDDGSMILNYNKTSGQTRFRYFKGGSQQAIQLYKLETTTPVTTNYYTIVKFKGVDAYEGDGGYYLIASPVSTNPEAAGMITDELGAQATPETATYDLYSFDQAQDLEWINYRQGDFDLVPGKGYLYANKNNVTLTFAGVPSTTSTATLRLSGNGEFAGWNLVGNPFSVPAYIGTRAYYRIGNGGADIVAATAGTAIGVMEGVFVIATTNNEVLNFSTTAAKGASVAMNVVRERGNVIDRAIVRFDEGDQLPKFQLNPRNTKIYVTEGNKDYAVVRSAAEAEMPVSFRASENGTYTLAVEAENVEMNYLHLIDNLTGMDVDLLQTPSYSFEARTTDYASRFRLVFKANGTNENNAETFAYFNGTNWTVSNLGEATLQVVDVTGRTLSSETINGNATISLNQTPGVYMLRLVNGNSVKVQKVVVR